MNSEVLDHPIPFLTLGMTLGEISDFKSKLSEIVVKEGISSDNTPPDLKLCKEMLYGYQWYRGDSEVTDMVARLFLKWFFTSEHVGELLEKAKNYFYLLGSLNFKFFEHLTILHRDYKKQK
ncbi:hypothetical protein [Vibrio phage pTD1]|uniref:Uncharacterized protein n=1 Tax=Vibrio phage pTD1 TaxID=1938577 RepID=A0A1Q2U2S2_9CAUD|nr:hypothetical protein FDH33_gp056 [Vibrio phage pTD1]BAW98265.1 hypothetical protein [Vibrio phage pTD1]